MAPARCSTWLRPSNLVMVRPSIFRSRSGTSLATTSISGRDGVERLLVGIGPALGDGLLDQRRVPLALRRERPAVAGGVGGDFLRHHLVDLLAAAGDGMSGADVRARCHRGDVGRHGDQKARRRGALPGGPDEHGDRGLRSDDGAVDVARRVQQPARRP